MEIKGDNKLRYSHAYFYKRDSVFYIHSYFQMQTQTQLFTAF